MNNLVPLIVAVPLFAAAVIVAAGERMPRRVMEVIAILTAAAVTAMGAILAVHSTKSTIVYWFGGWVPRNHVSIGIGFVADTFGSGLAAFSGLLITSALVFSWHYFRTVGALYHGLMLVFLAALAGFSLTGDLFTMFVFFELMSVAAYALTGYKSEDVALEGAINFGVTNSIAGYLVLLGIGLVYGRTGALNMAQIGQSLVGRSPDGLIVAAFLLIATGLFVKSAVVPFHFWLDDAHAVAPTPVCVIFSGVMVGLGLYGVARVFWVIFSAPMMHQLADLRAILVVAGSITALVGAVMCYLQRHIKRLLAFSTISHSGLALVGIGLLDGSGLSGSGMYLLGHGLVKAALFLCAGIVLHRLSSVDEINLRGKGKNMVYAGIFTFLGALGLAGLPPFATFIGKSHIEEAAAHLGYHWIPIVFIIASALTGAAVLRLGGRVFLGLGPEPGLEQYGPVGREMRETEGSDHKTPAVMLIPIAVLLAIALVFPYIPGVGHGIGNAGHVFLNRADYWSVVLASGSPVMPAWHGASGVTAKSIVSGLATALLAVIIAAASVYRVHFPAAWKVKYDKAMTPSVLLLRAWHNGHVGDYILWLMVGAAVFGMALTVGLR